MELKEQVENVLANWCTGRKMSQAEISVVLKDLRTWLDTQINEPTKAETHVIIKRENQVRLENLARGVDFASVIADLEYDALVLEAETTFEAFMYGFDTAAMLRERGEGKIFAFTHPVIDDTAVFVYAKDEDDLWQKLADAVKKQME